jgi:two-component system OmpR family response regulator
MKILIIEDDKIISDLLKKGFEENHFIIETAIDGEEGLKLALNSKYDLIILDLMLPKMDGETVLKSIRNNKNYTPILILSAKETVEDIVKGLQNGADDYLVKPFSFNELLARVYSLTRRVSLFSNESLLEFDSLTLNLKHRECLRNGQNIELHVNEYALLKYMLENIDTVITKSQILLKVWGYEFDPQTNVVDVLVCRLRNKIDKDFDVKLIHTVRGVGYVIKKD